MQLGSSNLTYKCSTMSPGNPLIWGLKGQGHESQNIVGVGLCSLESAGFFWCSFCLLPLHNNYFQGADKQIVTMRYGRLIPEQKCFTSHLNCSYLMSCREDDGRSLRTRGPATRLKFLSPTLLCVRGTTRVLSDADRNRRRPLSETRLISSAWRDNDWCRMHAT